MFLELTKVGMFLFVFTVPLNMAEAYFLLFWHLCGKWAVGPLEKGQRHLNALNANSDNKQHVSWAYLGGHVFICLHCALKYFKSLFSIILTSMWKMGCRPLLGRIRGILNALNAKFRQQATCFLSLLRWACFYLSSQCPLNMAEAYFPLFWHLCGKWAVGLPWEGSEAF